MKGLLTRLRSSMAAAVLAAALLLAGPGSALAQSSFYFWWQVVDENERPYTGQHVQCSVFRPNQHGAALLHSTSSLGNNTAAYDPLWSNTNGRLHFYSAQSDPVDVTCFYTYGGSAFVNKLDRFTHKIIVPRAQGRTVSKFSVNAAAVTYQTDSGVAIPAGGVIRDVIVQNLNPLALGTYHLNIGFLGNHSVATNNSLVTLLPLTSIAIGSEPAASPEWLRPGLVEGASPGLVTAGTHRGAALASWHASVTSGGVGGGPSIYREKPYVVHVATGLTVSYSVNPGTGGAARAHVFIIWDRFHTHLNRVGITN